MQKYNNDPSSWCDYAFVLDTEYFNKIDILVHVKRVLQHFNSCTLEWNQKFTYYKEIR